MKLAIFSDIHGNQYALKSFFLALEQYSFDKLIFCGDIFAYYYGQKQCIEMLKECNDMIWMRGNHDDNILKLVDKQLTEEELVLKYGKSYEKMLERLTTDEISLVRELMTSYEFEAEGKRVAVLHGTPSDNLCGRLYPDDEVDDLAAYNKYDIVIYGHTHFRTNRIVNGTRLINPGSLGQPRDNKRAGFALYDTAADKLEFIDVLYNIKELEQEILDIEPKNAKLRAVFERGKLFADD